jgi:hypothetical protein
MSIEVRPFRRPDRAQLTALVGAHVAAVVPGVSVSVASVLSHLERDPGEFVVDPWVDARVTLVAEQRGRVVAAAHLLRYRGDESVGRSYRDAAELRWFLFWPEAPYWAGSRDAADALLAAAVAQLDRWEPRLQHADGTLPAPGVYGVPAQWAHVRAAYERAGFVHGGRVERVWIADVEALPRAEDVERPDVRLERSVGINGTRLSALRGGDVVGFVELEVLDGGERIARQGALADVGNLHVADGEEVGSLGPWLVAQAAAWLRLGRVERLLDYTEAGEHDRAAFLEGIGFRELTQTARGWTRTPPGASET